MEIAGLIVNIAAVLVAVAAAIVAWVAVADARKRAAEAEQHEKEALAASQLAATSAADSARAQKAAAASAAQSSEAQQRAAAALERQVELAEEAARTVEPWLFEPIGDTASDHPWRVVNNTGHQARSVVLGTPDGVNERWVVHSVEPVDVERHGHVTFTWRRRLSGPSSATIWVHWVDGNGELQKYVRAIP